MLRRGEDQKRCSGVVLRLMRCACFDLTLCRLLRVTLSLEV